MRKHPQQVIKQPLHSKSLVSKKKSVKNVVIGWLIRPETWHFLIVRLPELIEKVTEFFDNI